MKSKKAIAGISTSGIWKILANICDEAEEKPGKDQGNKHNIKKFREDEIKLLGKSK